MDRYELHESLRMLCSLLLYKKFATEFVDSHGVQLLLSVPKENFTATDLALCFWQLTNFSNVMEKVWIHCGRCLVARCCASFHRPWAWDWVPERGATPKRCRLCPNKKMIVLWIWILLI